MNLHIDHSFDNDLSSVSGLTWLPWIGKDYKNIPAYRGTMVKTKRRITYSPRRWPRTAAVNGHEKGLPAKPRPKHSQWGSAKRRRNGLSERAIRKGQRKNTTELSWNQTTPKRLWYWKFMMGIKGFRGAFLYINWILFNIINWLSKYNK